MFTLVRSGRVYNPQDIGIKDILIVGDKIVRIADHIDLPKSFQVTIISAGGQIITPGLIDLHVHLLGGGGEAGPASRTPEITLSKITRAGVTTVIGCLGTDDVSRTPESLLAKAMQLEEEGISTFIYCGAYQFPFPTITGSIKKDIALIPKVVGVGEIAISDHRSSQMTFDELCHVSAEARVGGMLGAKAGIVHIHVGDGRRMLEPLLQVVKETEIPINQFLPTHLTRTPELLANAIEFAQLGGCLDFTVKGQDLDFPITTKQALQTVLDRGILVNQITLSSDSNGSMPIFNGKGAVIKLGVGEINNLYLEWTGLVKEGFSLTDILTMVTINPAKRTGIHKHKGSLEEGKDADLLILNPDFKIQTVMAKGRLMIHEGKVLVKGTFE